MSSVDGSGSYPQERMEDTSLTRTSTALLKGLEDQADEISWGEFDRRYRPLVLALARRLELREDLAEDAAQETMTAFVNAYRQKQYQRHKGRLRDWLCGIAAHKVRDLQRRQSGQAMVAAQVGNEYLMEQIPGPEVRSLWEEECDKALLRQALEAVRRQVSPRMFEAFYLYALEQWPVKQVAAHLNITEDVVYQSKRRILDRLEGMRKQLEAIWWD